MNADARLVFFVVSSLVLPACAIDERGPIVEPSFAPDKGDVGDRVTHLGSLGFDAPALGTFSEDLEFHAYRVEVRAGAVVTFDNTHEGTAAALDTTLFLYGPLGDAGFGEAAIAFDDDGGWGRHARIQRHRLDRGGAYLVVLGTRDGRGRGRYRLEARCESGVCAPAGVPERAPACEPRLLAYAQDCVHEQLADAPPVSAATAIELCTDAEALGPAHDDVCLMDPTLAFCAMTYEQFYAYMAPVCAGEAALAFPVDVLGLAEQPVPGEVAAVVAAGCPGDGCTLSARLSSYGAYGAYGDASVAAAVAAVWDRFAPDVPAAFAPILHLESVPDTVAAAVAALAAPGAVEVGALDVAYPAASGAIAYHTIYVVHDPASRRVLAVERLVYD